MQRLDRLPDAPFLDYALSGADVRQVRLSFQDWPRDPTQDAPARQVHAAAQRAGKTAAGLASAGFPTPLNETLQQRDVKSPLFPGPLSPGRPQPPSAIADTERGRS